MDGDTRFSDYLRRLNNADKLALAAEAAGKLPPEQRTALARELLDGTGFHVAENAVPKRGGK